MSDVKHTPGPWAYRPNEFDDWGVVRSADGELVAAAKDSTIPFAALDDYRSRKVDPYEGNARLIAAAPDLYRELQMHVRNCPVCKGEGKAVDVFDMLTKDGPYEKTDCSRCSGGRAALAKASGEQP